MPNEVQYAYFCHSLSLIAQILHYSGGRNLFPLTISSKTLSIQHLLVSWIKVRSTLECEYDHDKGVVLRN